MLGGVGAGEDHARDPDLQVADCLTEEIEEVGKVGHATDECGGTVDLDLAGRLVGNKEIVHSALDRVRLDGFLNLRNTVLLAEINGLVANEETRELGQELVLDSCVMFATSEARRS